MKTLFATPVGEPRRDIARVFVLLFPVFLAHIFTLAISLLPLRAAQPAAANLEAGFLQPPKDAKPMVFWHWINGNITKDGIRKDPACSAPCK